MVNLYFPFHFLFFLSPFLVFIFKQFLFSFISYFCVFLVVCFRFVFSSPRGEGS